MATFRDLKAFVEADGWAHEPGRSRQSARVGDHLRYTKRLDDGSLLRTKVSHALRDEIGADLFRHILREQLRVDEATFWAVVRKRTVAHDHVERPAPVPGWLVERLLMTVGLPEDQVRSMSAEAALAAWHAFQARPR